MSNPLLIRRYASDEDSKKETYELAKQDAKRIGSDKIISGIIEKEAGKQAGFPETSASFIIREIDRNHTNDRHFFELGFSMDELQNQYNVGFRYHPDHPDHPEPFDTFEKDYIKNFDDTKKRLYENLKSRSNLTSEQTKTLKQIKAEISRAYQKTGRPIRYFVGEGKTATEIPYSDVLKMARQLSDELANSSDRKARQMLRHRLAKKLRGYPNKNEKVIAKVICLENICGLNHMNDPEFHQTGISMNDAYKFGIDFKMTENVLGETTKYTYFMDNQEVDYEKVKTTLLREYALTTLQRLYYQQVGMPERDLPDVNGWCHVFDPAFYQYCVSMQDLYDAYGYTFVIDWSGKDKSSSIEYFDEAGKKLDATGSSMSNPIIRGAYTIALRLAIQNVKNPDIPDKIDATHPLSRQKCVGSQPLSIKGYLPRYVTKSFSSLADMEKYGYLFDLGIDFGLMKSFSEAAKNVMSGVWNRSLSHVTSAFTFYPRIIIPYRINRLGEGDQGEKQDKDWNGIYYVSTEPLRSPLTPEEVRKKRQNKYVEDRLTTAKNILTNIKNKITIENFHNALRFLRFDVVRHVGIASMPDIVNSNLLDYMSSQLDAFKKIFYKDSRLNPSIVDNVKINTVIEYWINKMLIKIDNTIDDPSSVESDNWVSEGVKFLKDIIIQDSSQPSTKFSKVKQFFTQNISAFFEHERIFDFNENFLQTFVFSVQDAAAGNIVSYKGESYQLSRTKDESVVPKGYHIVSADNMMTYASLIDFANYLQRPSENALLPIRTPTLPYPKIENPKENHTTLEEFAPLFKEENVGGASRENKGRYLPSIVFLKNLGAGDKFPRPEGVYFRLAKIKVKVKEKEKEQHLITYMLRVIVNQDEQSKTFTVKDIPIPYNDDQKTALNELIVSAAKNEGTPSQELKKDFIITKSEFDDYKTMRVFDEIKNLTVEGLLKKFNTNLQKLYEEKTANNPKSQDGSEFFILAVSAFAKSIGYQKQVTNTGPGQDTTSYKKIERGDGKSQMKPVLTAQEMLSMFSTHTGLQGTDFGRNADDIDEDRLIHENKRITGTIFPVNKIEKVDEKSPKKIVTVNTKIVVVVIKNSDPKKNKYKYYRTLEDGKTYCYLLDENGRQITDHFSVNDDYQIRNTSESDKKPISAAELGAIRAYCKDVVKINETLREYNVNKQLSEIVVWDQQTQKLKRNGTVLQDKEITTILYPEEAWLASTVSASQLAAASAVQAAPQTVVGSRQSDIEKAYANFGDPGFEAFKKLFDSAKNEMRLMPVEEIKAGDNLSKINDFVAKINDLADYNIAFTKLEDVQWESVFGYYLMACALGDKFEGKYRLDIDKIFLKKPKPEFQPNQPEYKSIVLSSSAEDINKFNAWYQLNYNNNYFGKDVGGYLSLESVKALFHYWQRVVEKMKRQILDFRNLVNQIPDRENPQNLQEKPGRIKTAESSRDRLISDFGEGELKNYPGFSDALYIFERKSSGQPQQRQQGQQPHGQRQQQPQVQRQDQQPQVQLSLTVPPTAPRSQEHNQEDDLSPQLSRDKMLDEIAKHPEVFNVIPPTSPNIYDRNKIWEYFKGLPLDQRPGSIKGINNVKDDKEKNTKAWPDHAIKAFYEDVMSIANAASNRKI